MISARHHTHKDKTSGTSSHLSRLLGLMLVVLAVELAGGLWTRSLGLLSDAGHVFMDALALALALGALRMADRPASDARTYGFHRLEVFSALINGLVVLGVSWALVWKGVERFKLPVDIRVSEMLGIAALGLVANLYVVLKLHPHAQGDLNVRGAFLHAFGDAAASVAVLAGGVIVYLTGWVQADSLAAILVAGILLVQALRLLRDSIHILLEGVPRGLNMKEVKQAISQVNGVQAVEDLHVWNICSHLCALSSHVVLDEKHMPEQRRILGEISNVLSEKFKIVHTTIQVESSGWKPAKKESPL